VGENLKAVSKDGSFKKMTTDALSLSLSVKRKFEVLMILIRWRSLGSFLKLEEIFEIVGFNGVVLKRRHERRFETTSRASFRVVVF